MQPAQVSQNGSQGKRLCPCSHCVKANSREQEGHTGTGKQPAKTSSDVTLRVALRHPLQSERRFGLRDPEAGCFGQPKAASGAQRPATEPLRTPTPCPQHLEGGKLPHGTSPTCTPLARRSKAAALTAGELGPDLPQLQRSARRRDLSPGELGAASLCREVSVLQGACRESQTLGDWGCKRRRLNSPCT